MLYQRNLKKEKKSQKRFLHVEAACPTEWPGLFSLRIEMAINICHIAALPSSLTILTPWNKIVNYFSMGEEELRYSHIFPHRCCLTFVPVMAALPSFLFGVCLLIEFDVGISFRALESTAVSFCTLRKCLCCSWRTFWNLRN